MRAPSKFRPRRTLTLLSVSSMPQPSPSSVNGSYFCMKWAAGCLRYSIMRCFSSTRSFNISLTWSELRNSSRSSGNVSVATNLNLDTRFSLVEPLSGMFGAIPKADRISKVYYHNITVGSMYLYRFTKVLGKKNFIVRIQTCLDENFHQVVVLSVDCLIEQ